MINVSIVRDASGFIQEFTVKGHAGYARHGKDIICAAASVTAYTAVGALDELAGIKDCHTENEGFFKCSLPDGLTEKQRQIAGIIMETTAVGFKQIELEYKKFILVIEKEV